MDLVLENGVDCSHTGFVHAGLFRSAPQQIIEAEVDERASGVRVETFGEASSARRDFRSWLTGGSSIRHVDELILPHTVRVDYWFGRSHVVTVLVCTPETDRVTRVYTRMAVKMHRFTKLVGRGVELLTRQIVKQDKSILEDQAKNVGPFAPRRYRNTVADVPAAAVQQAIHRPASEPAPERKRTVRYKL
jgi:phenylpropionate dioxygenase-like ring-hydroxylating dioxygenase large terminal subunit